MELKHTAESLTVIIDGLSYFTPTEKQLETLRKYKLLARVKRDFRIVTDGVQWRRMPGAAYMVDYPWSVIL